MNGRERINTATAKGEPDRVPVMCQLALGHYFLHTEFDAVDIWHDSEIYAKALVQLADRYGFDGVLVNLLGRFPDWRELIDHVEESGRERWVYWRSGGLSKVPPDDNVHYFIDPQTERQLPDFQTVEPERLWYIDPHNLGGITYPYKWAFRKNAADPGDFFPDYVLDPLRITRKLTGDRLAVHGEVFSAFSQFMEFFGFENGMMALVEDPSKAHSILARFTEGAIELGILQTSCDIDALLISDAFSGAGFISAAMYEEFVLPYNRRLIEGVKEKKNLTVYIHTCGSIGDRLEAMERSGVDGIDTFDPPPLGNVDIADAVQRLGKRVFIKGNLDPVNTLLFGSQDDVAAAARERIRIAGFGGAYILSTACSVAPHVPPENISILAEIAAEYGNYPIRTA